MSHKDYLLTWLVWGVVNIRYYPNELQLIEAYEHAILNNINEVSAWIGHQKVKYHPAHGWDANITCPQCIELRKKYYH